MTMAQSETNNGNYRKVKTGIPGLDTLFFGGLHLHHYSTNVEEAGIVASRNQEGIVIALRGPRGVNKTMLAVQMMHGLTKNIHEFRKDKLGIPIVYSLNKRADNLENMLLNFVLSRIIENMSGLWREHIAEHGNSSVFCDFLFDTSLPFVFQKDGAGDDSVLPDNISTGLDSFIRNNIITYNPRTGALHLRRSRPGDDTRNMLCRRRHDTLSGYADDLRLGCQYPALLKGEFFKVNVNTFGDENYGTKERQPVYGYFESNNVQKLSNFIDYLNGLQGKFLSCIVLEGFSDLSNDDLSKVEINSLEQTLRKSALISIIVFDKRTKNIETNADIVIDMRRSFSAQEEYTYNELQITKSIFQESVLGWHQYKNKSTGIEVYPSIHKLLHERNFYVNNRRLDSLLEIDYPQYMEIALQNGATFENDITGLSLYERYIKEKTDLKEEILEDLCREDPMTDCGNAQLLTERLLMSRIMPAFNGVPLQTQVSPVTAIIGNPNTLKGYLASLRTIDRCLSGKNTLSILLDRDERVIRNFFRFPIKGLGKEHQKLIRNCYSHIFVHLLRMGCISAEELFYNLKERLAYFPNSGRGMRIVMDNLHNIDVCFPFIKSQSLFVPTLINFCREKDMELDVICDKSSSMAGTLCLLADNVLCLDRDSNNPDHITIYVEKSSMLNFGKWQYRIDLENLIGLFRLPGTGEGKGLVVDGTKLNCEAVHRIGSTKNFWRQKYNVFSDK